MINTNLSGGKCIGGIGIFVYCITKKIFAAEQAF